VLVVLEAFPGDRTKLRPALACALLPGPYQTILVCGISTSGRPVSLDWDEVIADGDDDFGQAGLHRASVVRLSYLQAVAEASVAGRIGSVSDARLRKIRTRLARHIEQ